MSEGGSHGVQRTNGAGSAMRSYRPPDQELGRTLCLSRARKTQKDIEGERYSYTAQLTVSGYALTQQLYAQPLCSARCFVARIG